MTDSHPDELNPENYSPVNPQQKPLVFQLLKILIIVSVLFFGAVGILFAMGGGEKEFIVTQEIDATRESVFKLITEPESVKKWVSGVSKIEPVGEIKNHARGAKSRITIEENDASFVIEDEVTKSIRNQEIELLMKSHMFDATNNLKLNFKDDAGLASDTIVVTQTFRVTFKGASRIFAPFVDSQMKQQLEGDLEKLKQLAETGKIADAE